MIVINTKSLQINEEIRDPELRIIDADGSQRGIMTSRDALNLANEKDLDLVKISPTANPPVCRIMDYGKYCFEKAKKEKEQRKNQKIIEVKEVYLSLKIDIHDFETKARNAIRFLKGGDKVRVAVRFRGREMTHQDLGRELLSRFLETVSEFGTAEKPPKLEGRNMAVVLSPTVPK